MTRLRKSSNRKIRKNKTGRFQSKKPAALDAPQKFVTVLKVLPKTDRGDKIPTSLVALSPDKIIAESQIDVLVGLFHIMWEDMPHPRTYSIRLAELVSVEGEYVGTSLKEGFSKSIELWRQI